MKKLTPKQKADVEFEKKVAKAVSEIKVLVRRNGENVVRTASYRLWRALSEKERAQKTIKEKEKELAQLKSKFKL